jgi:pyridoxamine 5'-phosphate oxidase
VTLHTRIDYRTDGFDIGEAASDPITQWFTWFEQAEQAGCVEPNAMVVATIGTDGIPDARNVLVRSADARGIVFFTNYESNKSRQITEHSGATALFSWLAIHRQVKFRGSVERTSDVESDEYFASRPRDSQIGAWASPQSSIIPDRDTLDRAVSRYEQEFAGRTVTRPPHWGGWRIVPIEVEFWQGRPNRLHDRVRYRSTDSGWVLDRLAP